MRSSWDQRQLGETRAGSQVAGDHPAGGQLADDLRHSDGGMAVVVVREQLLVVRLAAVVQLLDDPFLQLGDEGVHVLAGRDDAEHPAQQGHVAQIGRDGLGDPGVLHLDRDGPAVAGDGTVHLPDRRGRDGLGVPLGEDLLGRHPQLFGDNAGGQFGAHRGHAVLKPAKRTARLWRQTVIDVAGHLAQLHQHALHRPQRAGHVLGGLQGQIVAELLPVLTRQHEQARRVAGVTRAAAQGQAKGGQATVQAEAADTPGSPGYDRGGSRRANGQRGEQGLLHATRAARVRRASRCRASSTPGSPRNTVSSTPRAWRISVRRPSVSGSGI